MERGEPIIIDGENAILGRLASLAAKKALEGREVVIVNAEKVAVSGTKDRVLRDVRRRFRTRTLGSLEKAPVHYRRPDRYVRRAVRGMLPWKQAKGKEAYKRVKVYIGVPPELAGKEAIRVGREDSVHKLECPWVRVGELAREIGGAS
ncbi:MAG: 50S ribosomal protein L13 [Candidatus Bathyarchaeia archaeon]